MPLTCVSFSYTAPEIHPSDLRAPEGSSGGGFKPLSRFSQHSPKRSLHLDLSPQKAHMLQALPLRPSEVPPRSNRRLWCGSSSSSSSSSSRCGSVGVAVHIAVKHCSCGTQRYPRAPTGARGAAAAAAAAAGGLAVLVLLCIWLSSTAIAPLGGTPMLHQAPASGSNSSSGRGSVGIAVHMAVEHLCCGFLRCPRTPRGTCKWQQQQQEVWRCWCCCAYGCQALSLRPSEVPPRSNKRLQVATAAAVAAGVSVLVLLYIRLSSAAVVAFRGAYALQHAPAAEVRRQPQHQEEDIWRCLGCT
jgi:hypothetical protein